MTELIAWSRTLSFGYLKHPPLAAWLVRLWFSLVPVADWSFLSVGDADANNRAVDLLAIVSRVSRH